MEKLEELFDGGVESSDGLEMYDEGVIRLAGNLYLELEKLVSVHGQGSITGLMPLMVSLLESLEGTGAQLREREAELEILREDRERLLSQYDREKTTRKHIEERYMELDDLIDQERKSFKMRLDSVELQTRQMELKARNYADQIASIEEQKTILSKEHNALMQAHSKIVRIYKDLVYQRALSLEGRQSAVSTPTSSRKKKIIPADFQEGPRSLDSDCVTDQGSIASCDTEKLASLENPPASFTSLDGDVMVLNHCPLEQDSADVNSTSLNDESGILEAEQPVSSSIAAESTLKSPTDDMPNSLHDLLEDTGLREESTPSRADGEQEEFVERNTDSLYAELSDIGPEYLEDVDEGADLQGAACNLEGILSENTHLKDTLNLVDTARKHLIARVDELMRERETLQMEVANMREMLTWSKVRIKDLEEDLKRAHRETEEARKANAEDTEVDTPAANRKRFTRAEMARVVMEKNQYKERLMELQDAVRRSELLRVSKGVQTSHLRKSPFWQKFSRLFSSAPVKTSAPVPSPVTQLLPGYPAGVDAKGVSGVVPLRSNRNREISTPDRERGVKSIRELRRDHYRHIRTHIWKEHGRQQINGWSQPPVINKEDELAVRSSETGTAFPALVQLRILDQKDPATKLLCATAPCNPSVQIDLGLHQGERSSVGSDHSSGSSTVDSSSLIWFCSGTHSVSEVMIIDAKKSNLVLDQFVICNSRVLCLTSVPGYQKSSPSLSEEDLFSPQEERLGTPTSLSSSLTSHDSVGSDGSALWERCSTDSKCQDGDRLQAEDCSSQSELSVEMGPREFTPNELQRSATSESEGGSTTAPTIWIGTQEGSLYIHSSITEWRKCLQKIHLKDSIHNIVHAKGYVIVALANGTVAIFSRDADGEWDLTNHRLLDLGRPHHSIRCTAAVGNKVWCGCRNRVYIINARTCRIEKYFEVTPKKESQVRHMAAAGEGVWVSVRLDSTLRLFHAQTGQPLQDIDIVPFMDTMFACAQLGLSFVQVSALSIFCKRLWIGTASGTILSIPFSRDIHGDPSTVNFPRQSSPKVDLTNASIPYCSMAHAQICFHGHRDAVRFFVSVPGCIKPTLAGIANDTEESKGDYSCTLVMSGGEGYINYRIGDDSSEQEDSFGDLLHISPIMRRAERSHLIVWQLKSCRN
ncbi:C-Jun-amino-terminal kinase-interacting protein 3-like [Protopterus annectens]|uniref:C-Jun-amino-terminal kinase-interacting protein 3-like n=1 Tax=Protopterus annectens TaxID=7888 RepID=UPI001CF9DAD2|nr:C-Jun-amino-terminal kinase-interacting protein 3-like [Protopterus annectens]